MTLERTGWTCPVCKRGVSPDATYCEHPARGAQPGRPPADMLREVQEKLRSAEREKRRFDQESAAVVWADIARERPRGWTDLERRWGGLGPRVGDID